MAIDFASDIGRVRLRVADVSDLPILPDQVYSQVISDNGGNLPRAAKDIACMILGILSFKGHRKLAQMEVWNNQFEQYKEFLILTTKDPAFMNISPIPYGSGSEEQVHPLIQFQQDWNKNYSVTQSQQLAFDASISPNDGSLYGILGNGTSL